MVRRHGGTDDARQLASRSLRDIEALEIRRPRAIAHHGEGAEIDPGGIESVRAVVRIDESRRPTGVINECYTPPVLALKCDGNGMAVGRPTWPGEARQRIASGDRPHRARLQIDDHDVAKAAGTTECGGAASIRGWIGIPYARVSRYAPHRVMRVVPHVELGAQRSIGTTRRP